MASPLAPWIAARITAEGPVTFAQFMAWALYHPDHGYYASGRVRVGHDLGDFTTAPHLTKMFARCLARLVRKADAALGEPDPFVLAEGGPGEGRLACDLLDYLRDTAPAVYRRLRYAPEEVSPALRARQTAMWEPHKDRLFPWPPPAPVVGLYFSNELLDAFPVHRVLRTGGQLWEVHVDWDGDRFHEILLPPSSSALAAHLEMEGIDVGERCEVEVNLGVQRWLEKVTAALGRGYVVTIDYGNEARDLYGPHHPKGTSLAYRGHRTSNDLLADPGEQDLTSHVDFTALQHMGERYGLSAAPLQPLRSFLLNHGILQDLESLEDGTRSQIEAFEARHAVAPLLLPGSTMGDGFQVLVQAQRASLSGLE